MKECGFESRSAHFGAFSRRVLFRELTRIAVEAVAGARAGTMLTSEVE
jgi:hypothetical protein